MAAALYPSRNPTGPEITAGAYSQVFMSDLDFRDNRYPSIPSSQSPKDISSTWDDTASRRSPEMPVLSPGWISEPLPSSSVPRRQSSGTASGNQREPSVRSAGSFTAALPPGAAPRVVEQYSLEEQPVQTSSPRNAAEAPSSSSPQQEAAPVQPRVSATRRPEQLASLPPSAPRHPSLPAAGIGTSPNGAHSNFPAPIMPLSASPNYNPPVSPRLRAYPQQPTYINQIPGPNPIYPPDGPPPKPQEEVCVECAMRDQDMADVDVTSPGIWERESDVLFDDLKNRDAEEEATGIIEDPNRVRSKGGLLTEHNLKIWLSVNPREPASKQQTLHKYLKSQQTLLEAEALAHARAMHEARQLDNKMRDNYSRLRHSGYDQAANDDGSGLRIRSPTPGSQTLPHARSHSRDVTLLENGMIVETVDVRKEEREAKEKRRKEERRIRKSSRGSGIDGTSLMSTQSLSQTMEMGAGGKLYSHYSMPNSVGRPTSVATAPPLDVPRALSQASFTDLHSLGSTSPRRSRFLGIGNFRDNWKSQDSLAMSGMSGSMVDMHLALHRDSTYAQPVDPNTVRRSQLWPSSELEPTESRQSQSQTLTKKKKTGLAKIWGMVTRTNKNGRASMEPEQPDRPDDNLPLAPPPPLSYLVNHRPRGSRHASTPSLILSPKLGASSSGMSPSTAPSTVLPSPTSSRPSGPDLDLSIQVRQSPGTYDDEEDEDTIGRSQGISAKNVHPMVSEPNIRARMTSPPPPMPRVPVQREKSLPPLPGEGQSRFASRPQTVYTSDAQHMPQSNARPHDFSPPQAAFRMADSGRRQSFGGVTSRPVIDTSANGRNTVYLQNGGEFGPSYNEFGGSRRSFHTGGLLDQAPNDPTTPSKRKSRFGLSSLLGKKSSTPKEAAATHHFPVQYPSGSDHYDEATPGYTSSSRHSAFAPRLSVTSRKALEDLVPQDPEFVAYRYPSKDHRLDA